MTVPTRLPLTLGATALGAALVVSACASTGSTAGDSDCVSRYTDVLLAPTWADLRQEMVRGGGGPVAAVRIQEQGDDLVGGRDQEVVRVVDLLDHDGHRVSQVDVWRTGDGGWGAGAWSQCID